MTTIRRPRPWTPQDDAKLVAWTKDNRSDRWIAARLGRTVHAIECRRKRIGHTRWCKTAKPEFLGMRVSDPTPAEIERIVNELRAARGCGPIRWEVVA